jgi:hypothetical protein
MPGTLSKGQRSTLEKITLRAREAVEVAARAALDNLAVHEERPRAHLDEDRRRLRNRLRTRGRAERPALTDAQLHQAREHGRP